EHYSRFIEAGNYGVEHLLRYAGILHFDKQYDKILPIVQPVLDKNPDNLVAKRLKAYALSKTEGGGKSIEAIKHFIETTPEERHIALDYICYAEQLVANEQFAQAIPYYGKIIQKDSTKQALWLTMGDIFANNLVRRDSADRYYALYEATLSAPDLQLLYKRGQNLYSLGAQDTVPERRVMTLHRADTVFTRLIELVPTFVPAHLGRARIHVQLDPETQVGLAEPFYKKVIEVVTQEANNADRYKRNLPECYRYLGYFHYLKADEITKKNNNPEVIPENALKEYRQAKEFFTKVLEYNPNDSVALEALQGMSTIQ
ncbi:MAG: hypothetical protein LBK12_03755, partial [Odoribacteraceae bacterium]|nr:hypothetical protein [Odoribacteraceae bacterium]